jgi:uncharacterized protein
MSGVRLRGTPPLPGLSAFPELNVRTYVRRGDQRGVWFLSLDAASRPAVIAARRWFHLPYFKAETKLIESGEEIAYRSHRTHRSALPAEFQARYGPMAPVQRALPGTLEEFLTERYCLFASARAGSRAPISTTSRGRCSGRGQRSRPTRWRRRAVFGSRARRPSSISRAGWTS